MEFRPFSESTTIDDNSLFTARVRSRKEDYEKKYDVSIEVDVLNDGLIVNKSCNCQGFFFKKTDCKHIKALLQALTDWEIEWREEKKAIILNNDSKIVYADAIHKIDGFQ